MKILCKAEENLGEESPWATPSEQLLSVNFAVRLLNIQATTTSQLGTSSISSLKEYGLNVRDTKSLEMRCGGFLLFAL